MKITRTSFVSGKTLTLDLNITLEQYNRWQDGEHAQNVFTNLNADEREFIISGIHLAVMTVLHMDMHYLILIKKKRSLSQKHP